MTISITRKRSAQPHPPKVVVLSYTRIALKNRRLFRQFWLELGTRRDRLVGISYNRDRYFGRQLPINDCQAILYRIWSSYCINSE